MPNHIHESSGSLAGGNKKEHMTKLKRKDTAYAHGSGDIKSQPSLKLLHVLLESVEELVILQYL